MRKIATLTLLTLLTLTLALGIAIGYRPFPHNPAPPPACPFGQHNVCPTPAPTIVP